jgi:predicted RNase H-like HicB family nuclease
MKIAYYDIAVEENDGGGFIARCADIQGAFAEGDTPEDAIANCIGVIDMIFAYRRERKETMATKPEKEIQKLSVSIPVLVS